MPSGCTVLGSSFTFGTVRAFTHSIDTENWDSGNWGSPSLPRWSQSPVGDVQLERDMCWWSGGVFIFSNPPLQPDKEIKVSRALGCVCMPRCSKKSWKKNKSWNLFTASFAAIALTDKIHTHCIIQSLGPTILPGALPGFRLSLTLLSAFFRGSWHGEVPGMALGAGLPSRSP